MPSDPRRRRILRGLALLAASVAAAAAPQAADASLGGSLARSMRAAGAASGAYVVDADTGRTLFSWRAGTSRILASNTKLFTTAAALARFGTGGRFETQLLSDSTPAADGVLRGDLWLRGGGDPAFGTLAYVRRHYGASAASVEALVDQLAEAGITAVRGGVHADESSFDSVRGIHDSRYRTSPWVGPLSAIALNHGLDGSRFQSDPPAYAAAVLRHTLNADGIAPGHAAASGRAPGSAQVLASVLSPTMATLVRLTNKESDNFFAEMLLKDIGHDAAGVGTTAAGARAAMQFAAGIGARVRMLDGSGLDHGDRAAPRDVVRLLLAEVPRPEFPALYASLPIAGVDGTIHDRMRSGPAHRNCRAKTGSLIGVSALSGFCTTRSGHRVAFSFLMNGVYVGTARRLQDRMAQAIAGWRG